MVDLLDLVVNTMVLVLLDLLLADLLADLQMADLLLLVLSNPLGPNLLSLILLSTAWSRILIGIKLRITPSLI